LTCTVGSLPRPRTATTTPPTDSNKADHFPRTSGVTIPPELQEIGN
jgi:hypothetical protein